MNHKFKNSVRDSKKVFTQKIFKQNYWYSKFTLLLFSMFVFTLTKSFATAPDANFSVDNTTPVRGQTVTFTDATVYNDGNVNSWSWNFGSGASPATATGIGPHNVSYTTTGLKTVSLTVSWPGILGLLSGSNTETKTDYINVQPTPVPTAGNNGPVCEGSTLSLTASNITGATYSWTGPNSFTSSEQNPQVSASATTAMAGTYSVTATLYGYTGSAGTTSVTINELPEFTYTPSHVTCFGGDDGSIEITVSGGTMPYQYRYSTDDGATWIVNWTTFTDDDDDNVEVINGLEAGDYLIQVRDNNQCTQTECAEALP